MLYFRCIVTNLLTTAVKTSPFKKTTHYMKQSYIWAEQVLDHACCHMALPRRRLCYFKPAPPIARLIFQSLFPLLESGTNREIRLEGRGNKSSPVPPWNKFQVKFLILILSIGQSGSVLLIVSLHCENNKVNLSANLDPAGR